MNNKLIKGLVASAVFAALTGCGSDNDPKPEPKPEPVTCATADSCTKFTVLHTNDNHGRFWESKYGEYGMAARKTLIEEIRAEVAADGGESILLSGGDINTGVPESDLQDARPDFIGMNLIEYDAMAVGNHEFDNPLTVLEMQRKLANFPMLAANIYKKEVDEDGKETLTRYFEPYKIFDINGLKIAVVGFTTKDTAILGNPQFIGDLVFTDPAEEAKKVIEEIKASGEADFIFATTHMGHFADGQSGSNAPGDVALARALPAGDLAAIIGGHSQNPVCMSADYKTYDDAFKPGSDCRPDMQNGTYIMQAHEWGKYVGRADFEYFDGKLHLASYNLIPVNLKVKNDDGVRVLVGEEITPDATVREILRPYQEAGQAKLDEPIADTTAKLEGDRAVVRNQQTNLGHFIATAQKESQDADFAVMNSGGVRASIEGPTVTYRDVLTVQPFGNEVYKATMNGADVTKYLNTVAVKQVGSGAYAQLVGLEMTVDCTASTVDVTSIGGEDYAADTMYSFTIPSYNAAGGDGYPDLVSGTDFPSLKLVTTAGLVDEAVLKAYIEDKGKDGAIDISAYAPVAGQVQYTNTLDENAYGCKLPE